MGFFWHHMKPVSAFSVFAASNHYDLSSDGWKVLWEKMEENTSIQVVNSYERQGVLWDIGIVFRS